VKNREREEEVVPKQKFRTSLNQDDDDDLSTSKFSDYDREEKNKDKRLSEIHEETLESEGTQRFSQGTTGDHNDGLKHKYK